MIGYGKLLLRDYGEKPQTALLRTDMESGPPKQARVRSKQLVQRPVIIDYSNAEYATFKTWFSGTLSYGANWFFWTDPRDGVSKQVRIVNGDYEAKSYVTSEGDGLRWEVSLALESWE